MSLTTEDDIAIIWDWDKKEISFINASESSPKDTTISHIYGTSDLRHVMIVETTLPDE